MRTTTERRRAAPCRERQARTAPDAAAPKAATLDLRDVSDPQVLKQRVAAALGTKEPRHHGRGRNVNDARAAEPELGGRGCGKQVSLDDHRVQGFDSATRARRRDVKGAPAVVAVAANRSGTAVYVLATGDCRLLTYQFLKR